MKKLFKVDIEPLQIDRNGSKVSIYSPAVTTHPPRFSGEPPSFERVWTARVAYSGEISKREIHAVRRHMRTAFQDAGLEFNLVTRARSRSDKRWPPDVKYIPAYLNPETLVAGDFRFPLDPFAPQKIAMLQADITARLQTLRL